jgi:hypothetical protein
MERATLGKPLRPHYLLVLPAHQEYKPILHCWGPHAMNNRSITKLSLACLLATSLSACFGTTGGQIEYFEVAEPIYADQTYTKTGAASHSQDASHPNVLQTGQAACEYGLGTIQRGSLVCPGY